MLGLQRLQAGIMPMFWSTFLVVNLIVGIDHFSMFCNLDSVRDPLLFARRR